MLASIILPVAISIITAALSYVLLRSVRPAAGVALGAALGFALGQWALVGWPEFPPVDVSYGIFYFVLAAGLGALLYPLLPSVGRTILPALILSGLVYFVCRPLLQHRWQGMGGWGRLLLLIAASLLMAWALQKWARRHEGFEVPLVLTLLMTVLAVVLVISRSASLGQIAGSLASVAGVWTVFALLFSRFSLTGGTAPVAVGLAGLVLVGHFYAQMPSLSALLMGFAPVTGLAGDLFANLSPTARRSVRIALAVVPALAALLLAYLALETGDDLYDL